MADDLFRRPARGLPGLDGIRALAVLVVVFFHAGTWAEATGSGATRPTAFGSLRWFLANLWIGVDAFFVLSGFLIGCILLRELRHGRVDYRAFYARRIARIFPPYYLVLVLAVFVLPHLAAFIPMYGNFAFGDSLRGGLKDALFVNNYLRGGADVIPWAWSLCVEEHFYLALPVFLSLLFRAAPPLRLGVLALLPFVPVAIRAGVYIDHPEVRLWEGLNFQSHTRCDGLLLGVLLAYLHVFHPTRLLAVTRRMHRPLVLTAVACFAFFFWRGGVFRTGAFPVVGQVFVVSVAVAVVLALCLAVEDPVTRCLAHPVWYPVARVSYGMYLLHPFVALGLIHVLLARSYDVLGSAPLLAAFGTATAICSFVLAAVLFLTVELPALRVGARVAGRSHRG